MFYLTFSGASYCHRSYVHVGLLLFNKRALVCATGTPDLVRFLYEQTHWVRGGGAVG